MKKQTVTRKQIIEYVEKCIGEVENHYGPSKHQQTFPYIFLSKDIIEANLNEKIKTVFQ